MKSSKTNKTILLLASLLMIAACGKIESGDSVPNKEPEENIIIVDDDGKETGKPIISIINIDRYENMEITDWLNENTVIVSKENDSLEKMSLLELSDSYPKSLYLFNIDTKEYQLLKEQKEAHLGGATLSSDKKNLLYYEYTLGDPAFYVMNMETLNSFSIRGVMSAQWADNDTIIGTSYSGGAYLANTTGNITIVEELNNVGLVIVEKIRDYIYYNTGFDGSLWRLDLSSNEKVNLNISDVYDVIPSPDGNKILVIQSKEAKKNLAIYDDDGSNRKPIAEGAEIEGASWSLDQRLIAYNLKVDANGRIISGLYIHDMLTGKSTQIAVDIKNLSTNWNTSAEELIFIEYNGKQYNSSIVYLKYSLGK